MGRGKLFPIFLFFKDRKVGKNIFLNLLVMMTGLEKQNLSFDTIIYGNSGKTINNHSMVVTEMNKKGMFPCRKSFLYLVGGWFCQRKDRLRRSLVQLLKTSRRPDVL